jgi:hypothetical protein
LGNSLSSSLVVPGAVVAVLDAVLVVKEPIDAISVADTVCCAGTNGVAFIDDDVVD